MKLGQVGTACCGPWVMFWRECVRVLLVVGMRGGGPLMVRSVSTPGPHSHPAAVERGGKDINRPSGIRAHSEE